MAVLDLQRRPGSRLKDLESETMEVLVGNVLDFGCESECSCKNNQIDLVMRIFSQLRMIVNFAGSVM